VTCIFLSVVLLYVASILRDLILYIALFCRIEYSSKFGNLIGALGGRPRQFTPEEAREHRAAAQRNRRQRLAPGAFQFILYQPLVKDEPELHGASIDITSVPVQPQAIQAIIPDEQPALGGLGHTGTSSSDTSHACTVYTNILM
jgi:hypothetical protein